MNVARFSPSDSEAIWEYWVNKLALPTVPGVSDGAFSRLRVSNL